MADDKKITVVAELTIESTQGVETIRSFDRAWHRMRELAATSAPVRVRLQGFVRRTPEELASAL